MHLYWSICNCMLETQLRSVVAQVLMHIVGHNLCGYVLDMSSPISSNRAFPTIDTTLLSVLARLMQMLLVQLLLTTGRCLWCIISRGIGALGCKITDELLHFEQTLFH